MSASSQTQTLKLSAAQVKMLNDLASNAPTTYNENTAKSLEKRGLVLIARQGFSGRSYTLTLDGQETVRALNGTQPAIEESAPAAESAPVIAETPAEVKPAAPKMGDTVTGETARGNLVTGKVTAIGCKVVTGVKYVHILAGSTTHEIAIENVLPGKMPAAPVESDVMDEDTAPVIHTKHDLYQAMKEAEEVYIRYMRLDTWDLPADHITYQRKVRAHINYLRASAAFTGMNNEYLIAYLYGPKNAKQTSDTGVSSAPIVSEVLSTADDIKEREIDVSHVLGAFPFLAYTPIEQDAGILAAKRQAQYEAAKARVEAYKNGAPKPIAVRCAEIKAAATPVTPIIKPRRPMTAAEQASEDGLQAMIKASRESAS